MGEVDALIRLCYSRGTVTKKDWQNDNNRSATVAANSHFTSRMEELYDLDLNLLVLINVIFTIIYIL